MNKSILILAGFVALASCHPKASVPAFDASGSYVLASAPSVVADGLAQVQITVAVLSSSHVGQAGVQVNLTVPSGTNGVIVTQPPQVTDANGIAVGYVRATLPGTVTVSPQLTTATGLVTLNAKANVTFTFSQSSTCYVNSAPVFAPHVPIFPDSLATRVGGNVAYSIAPALPNGLILDATTGTISGMATQSAASTAYVVTLAGPSVSASCTMAIEVSAYGDGSDGDLTVGNGASRVVNVYAYVTDATIAAGAVSFHVDDASKLSVGDEIIISQMQLWTHAATPLPYEYATILSISTAGSNNITVTQPLTFGYASGAAGVTDGAQVTQIITVPHFASVDVQGGGTLTAAPWDGARGGVIALRAHDGLTVDGAISVDSAGFRGGTHSPLGSPAGSMISGIPGESWTGPASPSNASNRGGGGGGTMIVTCDAGNGGGGGGYATPGIGGPASGSNQVGGSPGQTYGAADVSAGLYLGSGGGGPASVGCVGEIEVPGTNGGGAVWLAAQTLIVGQGSITANGGTYSGNPFTPGGGSGGTLYLVSDALTVGATGVQATGGRQTNAGAGNPGNGGDGVIYILVRDGNIGGQTNPQATVGAPP